MQDPLAKEIIRRVDASAYGVKGRARANEGVGKPEAKTKAMLEQDADLPAGHPSQYVLCKLLKAAVHDAHTLSYAAHQTSGRTP